MTEFLIMLVAATAGALISLSAAMYLLARKKLSKSFIRFATPFAAGALLAAVFFDLLPEGIAQAGTETVLYATVAGILIFFLAERFLDFFHHHHQHEGMNPSARLVVVGDIAHNALDGVAIAAAFLVSVPAGIATTIAVAAHEIPQEIGDFAILLHKGVNSRKVLMINIASSLATVVSAVIVFLVGSAAVLPIGALFGLSAGFLLYIAMSDIIPDLHEESPKKLLNLQPIMLLIGVVSVGLIIAFAHQFTHVETHGVESGGEHTSHKETHHDDDGSHAH